MTQNIKRYCGFDKYTVWYDTQNHTFSIFYDKKEIVSNAHIEWFDKKENKFNHVKDFSVSEAVCVPSEEVQLVFLTLDFKNDKEEENVLSFKFSAGNESIIVEDASKEKQTIKIVGDISLDVNMDVFPVSVERNATDFRCAVGNAISTVDNAIYNRKTDNAVVLGKSGKTQLSKNNDSYSFEAEISEGENFEFKVLENYLAKKYHIDFSPINRNSTFTNPPVGWMTWYAVKFDACEEKVLKNAKWQAENLKDFGANAVWVDFEWYHHLFYGVKGEIPERTDGVNSLKPDPVKYPNGMKYVADKIKELGLIPAIWIGYTNEPSKNEFIEKYPDILLVDEVSWCGRYYYDFSNPHYLNEYLPVAVKNVLEWGYDAIKFDTIPISMLMHNKYHANMYDPTLSTKDAIKNVMKKTREILGKDMYMLSCAGVFMGDILWASDVFDAARIGNDVFTWEEHMSNLKRLEMFYPLHNIQFYNDPDNVVLRDEFSDFEQAKSRLALFSLLGLPMNFGDEFDALSEEKIDLIKRSIPVLDIHPMDLVNPCVDKENFIINLNINEDYENYLITGIFNTTDKEIVKTVSLSEDLHLADGKYLVYDYYRDEFLGIFDDSINLTIKPYECRILSVRKLTGAPQIITTSRHISQGALEITDMATEDGKITFSANLIKNDLYTVGVFVPDGYVLKEYTGFEKTEKTGNILKLSYLPDSTQKYSFRIVLKRA